jgi:hypothetical protein
MSEPENFLERWSRRKHDAETDATVPDVAQKTPDGSDEPDAAPAASVEARPAAPFDTASLPSIESIGASSDLSAFLQPGVPPDLTRAALRRAWTADPQIRDFIGLVENGWDFNDPNGMPGFGSISADEVGRLLAHMIGAPKPEQTASPQQAALAEGHSGQSPTQATSSEPAQQSPQDQPAPMQELAPAEKGSMQRSEDNIATQYNSEEQEDLRPPAHRGRGGALPK